MAASLHREMLLHQMGNLVRIQPLKDNKAEGPALAIELTSCTVGLMDSSVPVHQEKGSLKIFGIIGLQPLAEGSAIAVITGAKQVRLYFSLSWSSVSTHHPIVACFWEYMGKEMSSLKERHWVSLCKYVCLAGQCRLLSSKGLPLMSKC